MSSSWSFATARSTSAIPAKTATSTIVLPFLAYLIACPIVMIVSGTIVDHICLVRSKCLEHRLTEVFIFGIHTHINSTFFCLRQSKITDICDHHFRCSHSFFAVCATRFPIGPAPRTAIFMPATSPICFTP